MNGTRIEHIGADGYIGWVGDQRTMLKRTYEAAQRDITLERFVCDRWPDCPHRDADACGRAISRALPRWKQAA